MPDVSPLRDRIVRLVDELPDEDLVAVERLLQEIALRRRMAQKFEEMKAMDGGGSGTPGAGRRRTEDGRGVNFGGWDEMWAEAHWGRRR